jgi:hypothetical protein
MTPLPKPQPPKPAFQTIQIDLLDRLLDTAEKLAEKDDARPFVQETMQ